MSIFSVDIWCQKTKFGSLVPPLLVQKNAHLSVYIRIKKSYSTRWKEYKSIMSIAIWNLDHHRILKHKMEYVQTQSFNHTMIITKIDWCYRLAVRFHPKLRFHNKRWHHCYGIYLNYWCGKTRILVKIVEIVWWSYLRRVFDYISQFEHNLFIELIQHDIRNAFNKPTEFGLGLRLLFWWFSFIYSADSGSLFFFFFSFKKKKFYLFN